MKKISLFVLITIIAASCSIQKRQYRSGYYIHWKNTSSDLKSVPEKSTQITLKQIELPKTKAKEPEIKTELIASREFKPAKRPNPIFVLPTITKAEKHKKLVKEFHGKLLQNHKTDLVSVGIIMLVVLIVLFLVVAGGISGLTLGQAIGTIFVLLLLGLLAILLLIIGLIIRLTKKNKVASSPDKS